MTGRGVAFAGRQPTLGEIRGALGPLLCGHDVDRAMVFGSYARGTQDRRSDIDLLVVKKTELRFLDRYQEFADIYRLFHGMAIDLLVYTPDEVVRNARRPFVRTMLQEGVVVYER